MMKSPYLIFFNAYGWHSEKNLLEYGFDKDFIYSLDDNFILVNQCTKFFGGYILGQALKNKVVKSLNQQQQYLEPPKVAKSLEMAKGKLSFIVG